MTMVPSKSRKQQNKKSDYVFYNNTTTNLMNEVVEDTLLYNNNNYLGSEFMLRHMAEEEDSSTPHNNTIHHHNEPEPEPEPEPEAVSTSKEDQEIGSNNNNSNNNNWLQLSIGFHQSDTTTYTKNDHVPRSGLELELLTSNWASSRPNFEVERGCPSNFPFEQTTSSSTSNISTISMSMPSGPISTTFGQQQVVPSSLHHWAFGPLIPHSMPIISSSSSLSSCSSLRPSLGIGIGGGGGGPYNYPPILPHHSPFHFPSSSSSSGFDPFRVVDPPRRPHSGIWFMLQASPNQLSNLLIN